ncbi:hypothetical protein SFRURICE_015787, partial [Spodoptera frugiperda]
SGVAADQLRNSQKAENVPEGKIKHLIGDVSTRWNSQLHMLERFIAMSGTVGGILLNYPNAPPMIQASEIAVLKEVVKILKPFEKVSEEMCTEKYVSANPRFKKLHLDDGASLARTINYIKKSIEENREPEDCPLSITSAADDVDNDDIWETHNKLLLETMRTSRSQIQTSELSFYEGAYPKLTHLACKHLLVPASSAPAERLFSKAGAILTKTRSRILSKRLPKLLFLNSLPTDF